MQNRVLAVLIFVWLMTNISAYAQTYSVTMSALEVSPDDDKVAVATVLGSLHLYDVDTGSVVHIMQNSGDYISDVRWSPSGDRLAAISFNGRISVWDVSSGSLLYAVDAEHPYGLGTEATQLVSISWHPTGHQLAVSGQGLETIILDALTGEKLAALQTGETYDNEWSPSESLITASYAGVFIWEDGTLVNKLPSIALTLPRFDGR